MIPAVRTIAPAHIKAESSYCRKRGVSIVRLYIECDDRVEFPTEQIARIRREARELNQEYQRKRAAEDGSADAPAVRIGPAKLQAAASPRPARRQYKTTVLRIARAAACHSAVCRPGPRSRQDRVSRVADPAHGSFGMRCGAGETSSAGVEAIDVMV